MTAESAHNPDAAAETDNGAAADLGPAAAVDALRRTQGPAHVCAVVGTIACVLLLLMGVSFCGLSLTKDSQLMLVGGCVLIVASLLSIFPLTRLWRFQHIIDRLSDRDHDEGVVDAVVQIRLLWQYVGLVLVAVLVGGLLTLTVFSARSR